MNFKFLTTILICILVISCSQEELEDSPQLSFEQQLKEMGVEDISGLKPPSSAKSDKPMLHFDSVEEFNQFRRDFKKGLEDNTFYTFDFSNFWEIENHAKSSNGDRVFQSASNAMIIIPSETCPPTILDPAQACDTNTGGGQQNGNMCGNKISHYATSSSNIGGHLNVFVKVNHDENGNGKITVTTERTANNSVGTYSQTTQSVQHVGNGKYRWETYGKATGTIGVSISPLGVGVSADWDRSFIVHAVGYYSPCGNGGAGSGGIQHVFTLANEDRD